MEHYLQTYTEPTQHTIVMTASTSTSSIATTSTPNINATSHADQVVLPLTTGCLTTNVGLPVIIVCSKVYSKLRGSLLTHGRVMQ